MNTFFYKSISCVSKILGFWVFAVYARIVATGFFLLFPSRVGNSARFYGILYPNRSRLFHLWCAWRQFHNFADVFMDRFRLHESDNITFTSEGINFLEKALDEGKGGILLMSHMGNWDVAAHLLKHTLKNLRLLLYMGVKQKEAIEQIQKEALAQSGIRIVAVDEGGGSPLDIVEGIKFIESGGVVSLTGDLLWKKDQRAIMVKFLGYDVLLPQAPYLLALLSETPLFIFFAFRTGKDKYRFSMSEPIYLKAPSREERAEAIQRAAQQYADILEATLRQYPLQWYHFRPFLVSDSDKANAGS